MGPGSCEKVDHEKQKIHKQVECEMPVKAELLSYPPLRSSVRFLFKRVRFFSACVLPCRFEGMEIMEVRRGLETHLVN